MNKVAGRAYNYEFKMHLEGIELPFKSANVVCTPNGVEFNINVHVNKELLDLKPKTAVQIWFREWHTAAKAWRMLADGFFSGYVTGEDSQGGRAIGITCRDFRMDIRKSPAAMAYLPSNELPGDTMVQYSVHGIKQTIARKKLVTSKEVGEDTVVDQGVTTRIYNTEGLTDLAFAMEKIAGTAFGGAKINKTKKFSAMNFTTTEVEGANGTKKANGGLFLDAFIRGIWMEAVGGTRVNSFLNKRVRADKRFLVPRNYAGFNFWKKNNFGIEVGTAIMGNSRFTSLEAAMMNAAGMFSCRVYSCNTPTLISLQEANNPGLEFIMDEGVRKFLVANKAEYGALYTLNETMLLPPLEFTAPPNCNLFFPPMYDRLNWRRDDDSDITRGYFSVIHSLVAKAGVDWGNLKFQVPNDLFGASKDKPKKTKGLPLTLEERYKGVSVYHGTVEYNLAASDAAKATSMFPLSKEKQQKVTDAQADIDRLTKELDPGSGLDAQFNNDPNNPVMQEKKKELEVAKKQYAALQASYQTKTKFGDDVATAYKRHAMIKYVNLKYQGRVLTVDMVFNPYVMAGFPGAVISAEEEMNTNVSKTMIGMVQQVSHNIYITGQGADASTTVIMNNVRFEDEPTDLDANGMPLYMPVTDINDAEVDIEKLEFKKDQQTPKDPFFVPTGVSIVEEDDDGEKFDLNEKVKIPDDALFVKDFLSTSAKDLSEGKDENIYVDRSYEPNRIFRFYEQVFQHRSHHFMLGHVGRKWFAYNSMHEAFQELKRNRPDLLSDYSACMNYIDRNICSADAFYHGILGLSSLIPGTSPPEYVNRENDFLDNVIKSQYFGVTEAQEDLEIESGGFSSIREHSPITAFIRERREAVEAYKLAVLKTASGVVFSGG